MKKNEVGGKTLTKNQNRGNNWTVFLDGILQFGMLNDASRLSRKSPRWWMKASEVNELASTWPSQMVKPTRLVLITSKSVGNFSHRWFSSVQVDIELFPNSFYTSVTWSAICWRTFGLPKVLLNSRPCIWMSQTSSFSVAANSPRRGPEIRCNTSSKRDVCEGVVVSLLVPRAQAETRA